MTLMKENCNYYFVGEKRSEKNEEQRTIKLIQLSFSPRTQWPSLLLCGEENSTHAATSAEKLLPTQIFLSPRFRSENTRKHLQITMYNDEKLFAAVERL
jgi:hypothetical protein